MCLQLSKSLVPAKKHVDQLLDVYGSQGVAFVCLINMKKDEQLLGIKFKELIDKLDRKSQLGYYWSVPMRRETLRR